MEQGLTGFVEGRVVAIRRCRPDLAISQDRGAGALARGKEPFSRPGRRIALGSTCGRRRR
jgi:hypothetical protein